MSETREESAMRACSDYQHWASEVRRLTDAIAALRCPDERDYEDETGAPHIPSCFAVEREVIVSTGGAYPEPRGPRTLAEVAVAVKDCPECSRLCQLIADRKAARQKWGAAKRHVRSVGKALLSRTPATPDPETGHE